MPLNLEPFALIRLGARSSDALVGHLLVTPWQIAFISATTERVSDFSWVLARHGDARVRAALIEYARWPLPLVLEPEDDVHALVTRIAPSAGRADVITVNLSSASYGGLINTLIAWRTADTVPSWPSVMAAMQVVASSQHEGRLRSIEDRGLDDTPLFSLTTSDGDPIVTMALWPSTGRLRAWVYQDQGNWIERVYWVRPDSTWAIYGSDGIPIRSLLSSMDVARDALSPDPEHVPTICQTADTADLSGDIAVPTLRMLFREQVRPGRVIMRDAALE